MSADIVFGPLTVAVPEGWNENGREGDRITFLHSDGIEHATISHRSFARDPSFSEFETLCETRLAAERTALKDGFLETKGAIDGENGYTLIFFGGDSETGRMFSGLLILQAHVLASIYIEGFGIEPQRHMDTFSTFANGVRVTGAPTSS